MNESFVDPTRAQFEAFKSLDRDQPIEMLNLVRFRKRACYPDDHALSASELSGAQAYAQYRSKTQPILKRVGGRILWRGNFDAVLIGPGQERWDALFIAGYPNAHAFLAMVTASDYRAAVVHRQAGVETSRLIRCNEADTGAAFG